MFINLKTMVNATLSNGFCTSAHRIQDAAARSATRGWTLETSKHDKAYCAAEHLIGCCHKHSK